MKKKKYVVSWLSDLGDAHQTETFYDKEEAETFFEELEQDATVSFPVMEEIQPRVSRKKLRGVS